MDAIRVLGFDANFYKCKLEASDAPVNLRRFHLFRLEN